LEERVMGDSSMPDKVREVYDLLWHDAAMLNAKRVLAQEWFWHAENMAVLQDAAGDAIRIVRDSVFHDLVVSIQRLLDPATQGKDENLCLERLADIIAQDNSEAGDRLRGRLNSTKAQHAIVTSWRNKRTGHRDLRVALGSNPLAGLRAPFKTTAGGS